MVPRNILSLTREKKQDFLNSFDHVFSDIDGVVWIISKIIEGSADGFEVLRQAGKELSFITNNSVRPEIKCLEKLRKNNINIEANHLMHPAKSVLEYLKSINFEGLIYILAAEEFRKTLRQAGFKLLEGPNTIINESFAQVQSIVEDQQPVKAVIIDYDFNLSFLKLMKANHYLRQPDCLLIGGATDYHLPFTQNSTILGPGPFNKVLEEASRKEMLSFGKPGKDLAKLMMQRYQIKAPDRVLMIGDMLQQDIRFATSCGFQSLLVLSGGCSYQEMMAETDKNCIPDYYAQSMLDFVEFMKDLKNNNV